MHHIYALASAGIGVAACFFGYRFFKVLLAIWGFLIGMALFADITMRVTGKHLFATVAGLIGGILVAGFAELLYLMGVFLMGATLGIVITSAASGAMGLAVNPVLTLSAAVVAGFIALSFQKAVIIWATAFDGSWLIVSSVALFQGRTKGWSELSAVAGRGGLFLAWLALGFAGVVVQYAITSKGVRHGPAPPQHKP